MRSKSRSKSRSSSSRSRSKSRSFEVSGTMYCMLYMYVNDCMILFFGTD